MNKTTFTKQLTTGLMVAATLVAQVPNPTQRNTPDPSQSEMVIFRVTAVSRSIKAINYNHRQGSTPIAFEGSSMAPKAKGEARVDSKTGATKVEVFVEHLPPATDLGDGLLTYVLWAITSEGRAENLGELMLDGNKAKLSAATELQTFGMIVTAEPYYAVTQPSDLIVMEAVIKQGTTGTISPIEAKYELMEKGLYTSTLPQADRVRIREAKNKNLPLDLLEARHAVAIAKSVRANVYAESTMRKAETDLYNAEAYLNNKGDKKKIQTLARNVTQLAEDARIISVKKAEQERLDAEQVAAQQRLASAQQATENEASKRKVAEADRAASNEARSAAEMARQQAEQAKLQADQARLQADAAKQSALVEKANAERDAEAARRAAEATRQMAMKEKNEADAALNAARMEQEKLRMETEKSQQALKAAEAERIKMRSDLLIQLNYILETRDSARGLIVNMSDVLFDTGKFTLKPGAREKLAKISGIVLAHPGLKLEVEGHTDSVGGDEYNQTLSEKRAGSVRDYLIAQGVKEDVIQSRGFGKTKPVASNDQAAGRQMNRRVELVVSGEPIQGPTGPLTSNK